MVVEEEEKEGNDSFWSYREASGKFTSHRVPKVSPGHPPPPSPPCASPTPSSTTLASGGDEQLTSTASPSFFFLNLRSIV